MASRFEKFSGSDGQFYFRLVAANNENILRSEGYTSCEACDTGITSVRQNAPYDARYERSSTPGGLWFFNLRGNNGHVVGTSQMYPNSHAMEAGISAVKREAPSAAVLELV